MRRVRAGRQAEARVPRMEGAAGLGGTGVWSWMLLVMWLPPAATSVRGSYTQRGHLGKVWEHSEVIEPRWLWPRTAGTGPEDKYPPYAEVLLTAGGRELVLSLQRNEQLITPNYTETYYSLADIPITRSPNMMEHCYYHGVVRGQTGSSVVASTCSGISGLITLNNNLSYIVEPMLEGNRKHLIYRAEHLELGRSNCAQQIFGEDLLVLSRAKKYPKRVRREDADGDRCVELYLVADYAEFQKHDLDLERTQRKMLEVTNYIDKFYRALKIRIALVGLEIWTSGDKCNVTENPYSTLRAFLAWRRKLLQHRPHDNAQLITGRSFHGTTIGLAPLQAMCSTYQSGGVNMDHSDNAIGVAATMAHEMGHNFGMSHDAAGCCSAKPEDGGCIMAAATGHPFPKVFNACNRRELDRFLRSGGGMCLSNTPDASTLYGGARCGNGFLEEGEECDCGDHEQCDNPCCNATTCTLLPGAECAHGSCCQRCKLKPPGFPCRKPSRPCDLPEFCTGRSPTCPPNSFQMDGTSCQGGQAFCYNGRCLTHQQQCRQLWGAGARIAPDVCFEKINSAGDQYGNCGRDMNGEYRRCDVSNAKCGKIQCLSPASKPLENNAVAIDTTITVEGKRVRCRGTHVYRAPEEEDMMDPGLVLSGTKCGENQICFEGLCRNTSFLQADECAKKCYGNGVCNNNQNCHCFAGWQPPYCKLPGNGGSIDSGPIPADGSLMLWVFIPGALLIGMALSLSIYFYQLRTKRRLSKSESSPAACPLRHSESQVKPCIVSTSGQRPHKQMLPKSPVPLHPNPKIEEQGHSQDYHKRKPTERGAPKTAHPVRIPPPSRPAPPPPAHTAPKISDPPKRAPPPIPPSRARQKAKQGDL